MPTSASQPTLEDTQLVGAALMRQFVMDRFRKENKDERLVQDAIRESITACQKPNDTSRVTDLSADSSQEISIDTVNQSGQNEDSNEHYQSLTESVTCRGDETVYQSFSTDVANNSINFNHLHSKMAHQLRTLAEEFEKDKKRRQVKEQADKIDLTDITKANFIQFLDELFEKEITREKIVVLFFFCTDVALKASAGELVVKLLSWSFSYIINTVCKIVHELGGWETVLFYHLPSLIIAQVPRALAALGVCALAILLRKSLRSLTA